MSMTAAIAPTYSDETGHDLFAGYLETLALIERLHRLRNYPAPLALMAMA